VAVSFHLEKPPGKRISRTKFKKGEKIRVAGTVTGLVGGGEPGIPVTLVVSDSFPALRKEQRTSYIPWRLGDFYFDITLPKVASKATIKAMSANFGSKAMKIAIGEGKPAPQPEPKQPEGGWDIPKLLKWGVIGFVAINVIRYLPKPRRR